MQFILHVDIEKTDDLSALILLSPDFFTKGVRLITGVTGVLCVVVSQAIFSMTMTDLCNGRNWNADNDTTALYVIPYFIKYMITGI